MSNGRAISTLTETDVVTTSSVKGFSCTHQNWDRQFEYDYNIYRTIFSNAIHWRTFFTSYRFAFLYTCRIRA